MPVGLFTPWNLSRGELIPSKSWGVAGESLARVGRGLTHFRTRLDEGKKRMGPKQLPLDGYDADDQTVYEFHGCYWHGHRCCLTSQEFLNTEADPESPQSTAFLQLMHQREERTEEKRQYL